MLVHVLVTNSTSLEDQHGFAVYYHNCTTIRLQRRMFGAHLDVVLRAFLATRAHFLLRYIVVPMSVHRLRTIDFQHLYNKMAGKLVGWDWE